MGGIVAILLLTWMGAEEPKTSDSVYRKAEVGDWVEYEAETSINIPGIPPTVSKVRTKQTVIGKTDKDITLKIETKPDQLDVIVTEQTLPIDTPIDPNSPPGLQGNPDAKVEQLGSGKEEITVKDQKLPCTWHKSRFASKDLSGATETIVTVWITPEIPLGGMVRMETSTRGVQDLRVRSQLVDYGRGKSRSR